MKWILKIGLSAVAVFVIALVLSGVHVHGYGTAIVIAVVLGILNTVVKPILVMLTLPITVFSLGLFLVVINAAIVLLSDYFISGFVVDGWLWAIAFSILLSGLQSVLHSALKRDEK